MLQTTGIVICSRSDSVRIPNKPFVQLNGMPILEHLIRRLILSKLPIYIAVPHFDFPVYRSFLERFQGSKVQLVVGSNTDPLARMNLVATRYGLENIIRICHDKIFVEPETLHKCLEIFRSSRLDYLYSSHFVDGSGFEIISGDALRKAALKYKNVEHIGYAIHCVTDKTLDYPYSDRSSHRLLLDYPEDLKTLEVILTTLGNFCSLKQALAFLDENPWISKINRLPQLTVYTCAYNAEKWIAEAMGSVAKQEHFREYEYLLIDDFSQDKTTYLISQFCSVYSNSQWFKNKENLGLASSSNVALSKARGRYILRLDADDYLVSRTALKDLVQKIHTSDLDVIYPDNYLGDLITIQKGHENHHVGGAIFRTRAANHVKFTEKLRGYEGYDFFERAKYQLKIGYHSTPTFFYRQHGKSMSQTDLEERAQIRSMIDQRISEMTTK